MTREFTFLHSDQQKRKRGEKKKVEFMVQAYSCNIFLFLNYQNLDQVARLNLFFSEQRFGLNF